MKTDVFVSACLLIFWLCVSWISLCRSFTTVCCYCEDYIQRSTYPHGSLHIEFPISLPRRKPRRNHLTPDPTQCASQLSTTRSPRSSHLLHSFNRHQRLMVATTDTLPSQLFRPSTSLHRYPQQRRQLFTHIPRLQQRTTAHASTTPNWTHTLTMRRLRRTSLSCMERQVGIVP